MSQDNEFDENSNDTFNMFESGKSEDKDEQLMQLLNEEGITASFDEEDSISDEELSKLLGENEANPEDSVDFSALDALLGEKVQAPILSQSNPPPPTSAQDEDIPDDINFDFNFGGGEIDNFQKEIENKLKTSIGALSSDEELDKMISEALEKDSELDFESQLSDEVLGFVEDVAVYDNEIRESTEAKKAKELAKKVNDEPKEEAPVELKDKTKVNFLSKLSEKMSLKTMYITVGAMCSVIIILAAAIFILARIEQKNNEHKVLISQPVYAKNNANYIYIGQGEIYKGQELILQKVLIDPLATVFYFNVNVDAFNNAISLIDNNDKIYNMDLTFVQFGADFDEENSSTIRFEPLKEDVKSFVLTIHDPITQEMAQFEFELEEPVQKVPVKYVNRAVASKRNVSDVFAVVDHAEFSSSGSTIYFALKWNSEDETLKFIKNEQESSIELRGIGTPVLPTKSYPNQYIFKDNKTIIGRMDFTALKNLNESLTVTFRNLFKATKINKEVEVADLFKDEPEFEKTLNVGAYKVVLERMGRVKDKIILVAHTEKPTPNGHGAIDIERIQSQLETKLIATAEGGMQIELHGEVRSNEQGMDIIFKFTQFADLLASLPPENFTLEIDSLFVKIDDIPVNIDLQNESDEPDIEIEIIKNSIISAFLSRLSYKSLEVTSENEIKGFSQDILDDYHLMQNYEPEAMTKPPTYSAQIAASSLIDDSTMLAIVQEVWQGVSETRIVQLDRTHKVIAKRSLNGSWAIISDEII